MVKKMFLVVFALLVVSFSYAQKIGIYSTISSGKAKLEFDEASDAEFGFAAGFYYEVKRFGNWYLNSSLGFENKKFRFPGAVKFSAYFVTVPVNIAYDISLGRRSSLYIQGGGYFDINLGSKIAGEKIKIGSAEDKVKRFDPGIGLGVGISGERFRIGVNHKHGFGSITNDGKDMVLYSNSLSLVYLF